MFFLQIYPALDLGDLLWMWSCVMMSMIYPSLLVFFSVALAFHSPFENNNKSRGA